MPNMRLIRAAVKPAFRHEQTDKQTNKQTDRQIVFIYIYQSQNPRVVPGTSSRRLIGSPQTSIVESKYPQTTIVVSKLPKLL